MFNEVLELDGPKKQEYWDDIFHSMNRDEYYNKTLSSESLDLVKLIETGNSVLDLGCGMGRFDIYLGEMGFDVTAIDLSETAVKIIESECRKRSISINVKQQDLCDFQFDRKYDLILAHGSLQFLHRSCWSRLIGDMKKHTNFGGLNYIVVFSDMIPTPPDMEGIMGDLFRERELFEIYGDWDILTRESFVKEDEHPGNIRHRHPINKLIARKK